MMRYAVIVEKGRDCYGAYVPDLPGCAVVAESEKQVLALIKEAMDLYLADLEAKGLAVPAPASHVTEIEVAASR
ncbi:MAG TPA: type II toxin-antitoxin system HicB family antitoxin [Candidatus Binataceae bacterium]|nr:type II toxin-antitoxin system HicB family antitoxin [Candidatus Binataceae bacterium]